jgi:hypothetical protein
VTRSSIGKGHVTAVAAPVETDGLPIGRELVNGVHYRALRQIAVLLVQLPLRAHRFDFLLHLGDCGRRQFAALGKLSLREFTALGHLFGHAACVLGIRARCAVQTKGGDSRGTSSQGGEEGSDSGGVTCARAKRPTTVHDSGFLTKVVRLRRSGCVEVWMACR